MVVGAVFGGLGLPAAIALLIPMEAGVPIPIPDDLVMLLIGAGGGSGHDGNIHRSLSSVASRARSTCVSAQKRSSRIAAKTASAATSGPGEIAVMASTSAGSTPGSGTTARTVAGMLRSDV
jgi:hypothetical protein